MKNDIRIIMTSCGLQTTVGYSRIAMNLPREFCEESKILIITMPEDELEHDLLFWCRMLGFAEQNITVFTEEQAEEIKEREYQVIYVSEGNTFDLLDYIRRNGLAEPIRQWVKQGGCYVGVSAGAHIAGMDVEAAIPFDSNRRGMTDLTGLALYKGVVIPHYNQREFLKYWVHAEAEKSRKYGYVPTIAENEAEVITQKFLKIIEKHALKMKKNSKVVPLVCDLERVKEQIEQLVKELEIAADPDQPLDTFELEIETGEIVEAQILCELTCGHNKYLIYMLEDDSGIYGSYAVPGEYGYNLEPLEGSPDEETVRKYILELQEQMY